MKPAEVASLHREICERNGCKFLDKLNYNDNCVACPEGHFGRYSEEGCEELNRAIPPFELPPPSPPGEPPQLALREPGDLVAHVIHALTGAVPCGDCMGRKAQMNEWGWLGCLRNVSTIVGWIAEEARRRGHEVDRLVIFSLLRAAWSEARKKK